MGTSRVLYPDPKQSGTPARSLEYHIMNHKELYIDIRECARRLDLSVRTIRNYMTNPCISLPAYKIGKKLLFFWPEIQSWVHEHKVTAVDLDVTVCELLTHFTKREKDDKE